MSFASYVKETKGEMKHVSWPTRKQVSVFTGTVISVSLVVALLLGTFDFIFSSLLRTVVSEPPALEASPVTDITTASSTVEAGSMEHADSGLELNPGGADENGE